MIGTNARTANGMVVVRGFSPLDRLVRRGGVDAARALAEEAASIVWAAETRDGAIGPEPRLRDPGATPARWVRLV